MGRSPAVLLKGRVLDTNLRPSRWAPLRQVPMGHRGSVEIDRISRHEVLGWNPVVVLTDKRFARTGLLARQPLPDPRANTVDEVRLHVRSPHSHLDITLL